MRVQAPGSGLLYESSGKVFIARLVSLAHVDPMIRESDRWLPGETGRGRVLVVDTRPAFAEGAADLLRREGYEAHTVYPVRRAERRARRLVPELVLLGPGLPAGQERATLRRLRRATRTAGVPVFRIADGTPPERIAAGFAAGLDDLLLRPFFPDELFGRIDRAVERLRSLRRLQGPGGLPAGRAAMGLLDEALSRPRLNAGGLECLLLYLPGRAELLRSDRRDTNRYYEELSGELPHRLAEIWPGEGGPVLMAEARPGQIYLMPDPGGAGTGRSGESGSDRATGEAVERNLCRLLAASDRWLAARGANGRLLAEGTAGQLKTRALPRFHLLRVSCGPAIGDFAALHEALRLELARDHSERRGGRYRQVLV